MSDCPLGTLYSKAAAPSESRKVILPGRSILKKGEAEVVRDTGEICKTECNK